ncbi:MAG TPA: LUD domain-containing protein, partial [Pyrinomonadaceae bacterium]|nr:LUD domain-containing protein [Pyrinomonadaceae bacterium]
MIEKVQKEEARAAILKSIRDNLAASARPDAVRAEIKAGHTDDPASDVVTDSVAGAPQEDELARDDASSLREMFIEKLEAVGGRCFSVRDETEAARVLAKIISDVQTEGLGVKRIALSDSPLVKRLMRRAQVKVDEIAVTPGAAELFGYDVGISSTQGAIAETGTLVLESGKEQHRLLSLVPPVHIAIIEAASIRRTLGETLLDL